MNRSLNPGAGRISGLVLERTVTLVIVAALAMTVGEEIVTLVTQQASVTVVLLTEVSVTEVSKIGVWEQSPALKIVAPLLPD